MPKQSINNQAIGTVIDYPSEKKEAEFQLVERELAPVVRTYDELCQHLNSIENKTKVLTSGFFNPVHKNHISNIISSKWLPVSLLNYLGFRKDVFLTVAINGDWSTRKKLDGKLFMSAEHRADVVRAIKGVDLVFIHDDKSDHQAKLINLGLFDIFTKGGDRNFDSLPVEEQKALINTKTILVGDVGYDKKEGTSEEVSSSKLRFFTEDK